MEKVFFKPWIGKDYKKGIKHKKIMVLGASHYCNHNDDCPFFNNCTRNSCAYESKCPFYEGMHLSDTTINEVNDFLKGEANDAYDKFTDFMVNEMGLACTITPTRHYHSVGHSCWLCFEEERADTYTPA